MADEHEQEVQVPQGPMQQDPPQDNQGDPPPAEQHEAPPGPDGELERMKREFNELKQSVAALTQASVENQLSKFMMYLNLRIMKLWRWSYKICLTIESMRKRPTIAWCIRRLDLKWNYRVNILEASFSASSAIKTTRKSLTPSPRSKNSSTGGKPDLRTTPWIPRRFLEEEDDPQFAVIIAIKSGMSRVFAISV